MHIFLMCGDLLYSIVLMVVSTNYLFLPANTYIELCTPRLSGKPSAESLLFTPDTQYAGVHWTIVVWASAMPQLGLGPRYY